MTARGVVAAAACAVIAACSAPRATPAVASPAAATAPEGVVVRVEFEPPLAAGGMLHVAHESGFTAAVEASPTGVEIVLPPGPVLLRLETAGRSFEIPWHVDRAAPELCWRLGECR